MFCKKCGEENPENAVFCRNWSERLKEDVKKAEVIEAPVISQNNNYQSTTTNTTTTKKGGSDWMSCCFCVIAVFIVFAIFGLIFH